MFILPTESFADTLDFWSVYLNDSLIAELNMTSDDFNMELDKQTINVNDTISIVYGNDHPCYNCEYYYAVKDRKDGIKIHVERRNRTTEKVYFPLIKLKEYTGFNEFEFFVYEHSYVNDDASYLVLFTLKLE